MDALSKSKFAKALLENAVFSFKPLTADEFIAVSGKIADLKVGDKLLYLGNGGYKAPEEGDTVIVASLDVPVSRQDRGAAIYRDDFTSLFKDSEGNIVEFSFDSRYFRKVEFSASCGSPD
jgi:hypothetical protein